MATTIFTAGEYDPRKERRKRQRIIAAICLAIIIGALAYMFRNWTYEHRVSEFLTLLEQKDYQQAYGLWLGDPNWQQHPAAHANYSFADFYKDWGPGGDYGVIRSYRIVGSVAEGSGVIVVVSIDGRVEPVRLWVEKKDKSLTWSPF